MNNNDIFRRLRYIFNLREELIVDIFNLSEKQFEKEKISGWLQKEDSGKMIKMHDIHLASFLNGFISFKRGKKDGPQPKPEKKLNNNLILRKLKIALSLKDFQMVEIFDAADFEVSSHEINAFFRKPGQKQYRICKDQFLRNFLMGLQLSKKRY